MTKTDKSFVKRVFFISITVCLLGGSPLGFAQVDPSSAILLRSGGRAPTKGEFDSGRYSIRPNSSGTTITTQQSSSQNSQGQNQSQNQKTEVVIGNEEANRRQPSKSDGKKVEKIEIEEAEHIEGRVEDENAANEKSSTSETESQKNLVQDLRELFLGGSTEEVDDYLGKVEASDPRNNLVEFTVAPLLLYNDSSSTYWYRDYYSYGPGLNLNAKLWLSPFFGISTTYQTTFNSEVRNSPADTSTEPVKHEWFGAELQFRSYFGVSRKAPSLTLGLGFTEYQMKGKSDSATRIGVKSSGFKISVDSVIPSTRGKAWTMGLELTPRASHKEVNTQISPKSGKHDETNVIGLSLGRRYTFSRSQVLFWKLQHHFEKNAFKDSATQVDPIGRQPENVSVTNTRTMFLFGFTWGN